MRIATIPPASHIGVLRGCVGLAQILYIELLKCHSLEYRCILLLPPLALRPKSVQIGQLRVCKPGAAGKPPQLPHPHTCWRNRRPTPIREKCSILFSLLLGFGRLVQTPTARESPHGQQAHGAFQQATPASSAEDERSVAMARSRADSANGTNTLR
jgi:hypothetical protein